MNKVRAILLRQKKIKILIKTKNISESNGFMISINGCKFTILKDKVVSVPTSVFQVIKYKYRPILWKNTSWYTMYLRKNLKWN